MKYCSFFIILIVSIILPLKNESEACILRDWLHNCLMNRKITTTSNSLTKATISPKLATLRIIPSVTPFIPSTTDGEDVGDDNDDSDLSSGDGSDDDREL